MKRTTVLKVAAGSIGAVVILGGVANGQSSIAANTGEYAIVGARIEIGDGRSIETGTVVIKGGVITEVAANVAVPRGAEVVDGHGLTVYPGFIDAYSTKGLAIVTSNRPAPSDPNGDIPNYASAFMRETVRNGVHPEFRTASNLALTDDVLKSYRSAGFTTAMVSPSGGDINGVGALVNLSGRPARECVVVPDAAESFSFGGPNMPDGYPSSLLGHVAQIRQSLVDAGRYGELTRSFAAGGVNRAPTDDSMEALHRAVSDKMPCAFEAETRSEIIRSLDICSEFGLKPIIVGGSEAWKCIDMLVKANASVILSMPFRKEPTTSPEASDSTSPDVAPNIPEDSGRVAERMRLYTDAVKNASVLAQAGIPFALTSKGVTGPSVLMENLAKAVRVGLPKAAALQSLTLAAAKIYGVGRQMGAVQTGMIASLTVTSGDFLDPKMKVRMLFIDGHKIEIDKGIPPAMPKPITHEGVR